MTVLRHLFSVFGRLYVWFWLVMAIFFAGVVTLFAVFGERAFAGVEITMWQGAQQAPRWFLFVIGILVATTALPVGIAHGLTRSALYRGGLLFTAASAVLFTIAAFGGFALEAALFAANGGIERLPESHPMISAGDALTGGALTLTGFAAHPLSGWAVGVAFYRLRWWQALPLTPLALMPIAWLQLPPASPPALRLGAPVVAMAVAVPLLHLLMRTMPLRPRKA